VGLWLTYFSSCRVSSLRNRSVLGEVPSERRKGGGMNRQLRLATIVLAALSAPTMLLASDEPDELMPGKILVIKAGKIAKFVAKPTTVEFTMPDIVNNNPTLEGGEVRFFDTTIPGGGDITYSLPAGGWTGIGNPPGSKGYKFKGGAGTCKVVILKPKVIKDVCKETVHFTNPFSDPGTVGVILTAGTDSKRYCAEFGG